MSPWTTAACLISLVLAVASQAAGQPAAATDDRVLAYQARRNKTVLDLQPWRQISEQAIEANGMRRGTATLININPAVNRWHLLRLDWGGSAGVMFFHLENPEPRSWSVELAGAGTNGLRLTAGQHKTECRLWSGPAAGELVDARGSGLAYAPLCAGRLFLRNRVTGRASALEKTTDLLRDHVPGGERIIGFVRRELYRDAFIEKGDGRDAPAEPGDRRVGQDTPGPARMANAQMRRVVQADGLGIDLPVGGGGTELGAWYPVSASPGIHLSVVEPRAVDAPLAEADRVALNPLDPVEAGALVFLVAFDLARFDLGFAVGTDHPRVDWAGRVRDDMRDSSLVGPDGIASITPLVATGMVSPANRSRVAATFTGGFKRLHGAFHEGVLAQQNSGSHYGFIENGAILSKLMPGLATLYVLEDGSTGMKTWTGADDLMLPTIRHARQNGVALVERDPARDSSVPGSLVRRWSAGNWSGSETGNLRSLRAGACLHEHKDRRFLVYGYFSSATPSAMARVFLAYGCRYAMHLDMNALEHTYLALYRREQEEVVVQNLVKGMSVLDRNARGRLVPRFLAFPDDRDFFFLLRKESSP